MSSEEARIVRLEKRISALESYLHAHPLLEESAFVKWGLRAIIGGLVFVNMAVLVWLAVS
jgi:hypothetical protein